MFNETFASLLKSKGMNPLSLAKAIGVPKSIVYEWKNGLREPSMENLVKLSDYFEVSLEYLTGKSADANKSLPPSEEEAELLLLLRAARQISEEDHNALVRSFKANLDVYLKSTSNRKSRRKAIEDEAVKLLLLQPMKGELGLYFLDCRRILTGGIATIDSMSTYESRVGTIFPFRTDGMTVKQGDMNMVFYDDRVESRERINWTIAHELGHIILAHTENSDDSQRQADEFAASFLIPEAVLRFLDLQKGSPLTPEEMTLHFPASFRACELRRAEISHDESYVQTDDGAELIRRLYGCD